MSKSPSRFLEFLSACLILFSRYQNLSLKHFLGMEFLSQLHWWSLEFSLLLWLFRIFPSLKNLPGCPQTYPIHPSIHHYVSKCQLKEEKWADLHLLPGGNPGAHCEKANDWIRGTLDWASREIMFLIWRRPRCVITSGCCFLELNVWWRKTCRIKDKYLSMNASLFFSKLL